MPSGSSKWVYSDCPGSSAATSLVQTASRKAQAPRPEASHTPMWATSNRPAAPRTARCSSTTLLYQTGISQPANGTIFAPSALWVSWSGVNRSGCSAGSFHAKSGSGADAAGLKRRDKIRARGIRRRVRTPLGIAAAPPASSTAAGPGIFRARSSSKRTNPSESARSQASATFARAEGTVSVNPPSARSSTASVSPPGSGSLVACVFPSASEYTSLVVAQ